LLSTTQIIDYRHVEKRRPPSNTLIGGCLTVLSPVGKGICGRGKCDALDNATCWLTTQKTNNEYLSEHHPNGW